MLVDFKEDRDDFEEGIAVVVGVDDGDDREELPDYGLAVTVAVPDDL